VAILDSHSCVADPNGLDLRRVLRAKESSGRLGGAPVYPWDLTEALRQVPCDVVVEMSVSSLEDGEPGTSHLLSALGAGVDAVTSNKGPFALHYRKLAHAARSNACQLRFGTTVGGPIPILELVVDHLAPGEAMRVRGIANSTTQFILDRVGHGASFDATLREAQRLGIAEANPRRDLEGWDAAWKAAIIHNCLFAPPLDPARIPRDIVRPSVVFRARRAVDAGKALAVLADIRPGRASVRLVEVPGDSPWAVRGSSHIFEVETRGSGRILLQGWGAGPAETASGIYADLIALHADRSRGTRSAETIRWPPLPRPTPRRSAKSTNGRGPGGRHR